MFLGLLSPTQIDVLESIDHTGWYGQLWFPAVDRTAINFPDGPSDDEIHAALFSLIESGVLEVWRILDNDAEIRIQAPPPEVIAALKKDSPETDVILQISPGVIEELHASERRKWIEIRDTD